MPWRSYMFGVTLACLLAALTAQAQTETEIQARKKLFPELTADVQALKRTGDGRYFVLTTHAVFLYDAAGAALAQIPARSAAPAKNARPLLVYAVDLDVASDGHILVADRGGNAVRIFSSDGALEKNIPADSPTGVVALSEGEIAVASTMQSALVTVFDAHGKVVRQFGEHADLADNLTLNNFLNSGRLASDARGNLYYAFSYYPEPTFRRYDRYGYATLDTSLTTLEFMPTAQAARKVIARRQQGEDVNLRTTIDGLGVDPVSGRIWIAIGDLLLSFDSDGNRTMDYRTYTPEGARLQPRSIVVEPQRLLLISELLGVFEFERPDKPQIPAKTEPSH
jgi:hypothetical protein